MMIAGATGWLLLYWLFPASYFRWYPLVPAYFILLGFLVAAGMARYSRSKPAKSLMIFVSTRIIKIILTAGSIFLYFRVVGEDINVMILTISLYYLLFLFVEIWIFFRLGADAPLQ